MFCLLIWTMSSKCFWFWGTLFFFVFVFLEQLALLFQVVFFQRTRGLWARDQIWRGEWSFRGLIPAPWNHTTIWGHCTPGASLSGCPQKVNEWNFFFFLSVLLRVLWACDFVFQKGNTSKGHWGEEYHHRICEDKWSCSWNQQKVSF